MISIKKKSITKSYLFDDCWVKDTEIYELDLKGSCDQYDQNSIWNTALSDWNNNGYGSKWYGDLSTEKYGSVYTGGYCNPLTVYPAVAIGDLVEVRESDILSVVTAVGDNGMGETVYQIHCSEAEMWVTRPQLRKVL